MANEFDTLMDDEVMNELNELEEMFDSLIGDVDAQSVQERKNPSENKFDSKFNSMKLILGVIDDAGIVRPAGASSTFQLNTDGIVNQTRGLCCLKFFEGGGVKNASEGGFRRNPMPDDPDLVEKRHLETGSLKERVQLTSPFVWDNENNWMGIDYLPPVGAKVIIGFEQSGEAYILGYLPQSFQSHKYLKDRGTIQSGEMVLKGFGNNFIHLRKSNKLVLQAYADSGSKDIDQPDGQKTAGGNHKCEIFLDGDNGRITFSVGTNQLVISEDGIAIMNGTKSGITLNSNSISLNTTTFTNMSANIEHASGSSTMN